MIHSMAPIRASVCAAALAIMSVALIPRPAFSADKPKEQQISHTIGKEIEAAQKAMKASQWSDVIKNVEAAEAKGSLTTFDKKTIYDFKGFAYIKLGKYKEAEAAYEQAIATGGYNAEESAKTTKMLFQLAAQNQQFQ